jgi:hypothetical protein
MPVLRLVDGEKRFLLSMHGMWQHQWMFIRKQLEYDMAKSVNKVILVGNVGQDPEVRYTASGVPVAKVSLATNERFKERNEQWQDKTEWHSVVAWQRLAEIVESTSARDRSSTLKASCKHRPGKTGRMAKKISNGDCRAGHCPARFAGQWAENWRRNSQRTMRPAAYPTIADDDIPF